jgi:hypothetical protein
MTTTAASSDAAPPDTTTPIAGERFASVPALREQLRSVDYLSDEGIAGIVYLADRLGKPILVEGPAGTGKTQLAKSVAEVLGARLIRLQCYEGLDESKALYEWNYKKQLLRIQATKADSTGGDGEGWEDISDDIFSDDFLLEVAEQRCLLLLLLLPLNLPLQLGFCQLVQQMHFVGPGFDAAQ